MKCNPETFFQFQKVHPSWMPCLKRSLKVLDQDYLDGLTESIWLPGPERIFNAFSLPLNEVKYVLLGESPYPRPESAIGYAFWDGAVNDLWSEKGLSTKVNRATSLRNLIKMLLIAEGVLDQHPSQDRIAEISKNLLVKTNKELFTNFLCRGFLLLNASLVLKSSPVHNDSKAWNPFVKSLLSCLIEKNPNIQILLLGRLAAKMSNWLNLMGIRTLEAEHPYNLSFITNPEILAFFRPLHLLRKENHLNN